MKLAINDVLRFDGPRSQPGVCLILGMGKAEQAVGADGGDYVYGGRNGVLSGGAQGLRQGFNDEADKADTRTGALIDNQFNNQDRQQGSQWNTAAQQDRTAANGYAANGMADYDRMSGFLRQGPDYSGVQGQLNQGLAQNQAQANNMAANARPGQEGAALRGAMMANQNAALGTAAQAIQARAQVGQQYDQNQLAGIQAQAGIANNLQNNSLSALGQDFNGMGAAVNQQNADLGFSTLGTNSYYQNRQQNDQRNQYYNDQASHVTDQAFAGAQGYQGQQAQINQSNAQQVNQKDAAGLQALSSVAAGAATGGASAAAGGLFGGKKPPLPGVDGGAG